MLFQLPAIYFKRGILLVAVLDLYRMRKFFSRRIFFVVREVDFAGIVFTIGRNLITQKFGIIRIEVLLGINASEIGA